MVACPCCLINLHAGTDDGRAGASLQQLEDDKATLTEGKQERTGLGLSCCVVSVQGRVSVLLVEQPVVSSATTAVGEQPALRCWGGVGGFGSCHKNSAGLRGQSQRVASAELLPAFVLIAVIYN